MGNEIFEGQVFVFHGLDDRLESREGVFERWFGLPVIGAGFAAGHGLIRG
jgi:hypothetical protein